jgi:hypothetical protein
MFLAPLMILPLDKNAVWAYGELSWSAMAQRSVH